ncbi:MAG: hypothetical protein ABI621_04475 [Chloroflexota bacterium]
MNFNFGEVLSRAWQIIWKHKVLWIFGILASCTRSGSNFNSNSNWREGGDGGFGGTPNFPPQLQRLIETISENMAAFIAITVAVICIFWIVAIFLGTIGKIGLIRGTWQAERVTGNLIFGQLFSESMPYFWRMFGLSLIMGLPFLVLIAVLVAGGVAFGVALNQGGSNTAALAGLLALVPLFIGCMCLLIPVGFVINMIVRQAQNAIVLEEASVLPSISRGWDIFRTNLGPIIVMAIILTVIGLVAGFIIALPVLVVVIPATIAFVVGNAQNWTPMIVAGALLCLYIPISMLINGILVAYTESVWTLTYMRLTRKPDVNDIMAPATPPAPDDSNRTIISSFDA